MKKKSYSRFSKKIRYGVIGILVKYITPSLYHALEILGFIGAGTVICHFSIIGKTPRPAKKVMKKHFLNSPLIGAEIGVWRGDNSESLLKELNIKKLYLIDAWEDYDGAEGLYSDLNEDYLKRFG